MSFECVLHILCSDTACLTLLPSTREREQHKETLTAAAHRALQSFQSDISECHSLVIVSRQIAVIDCLMSFAQVAAASGYCKPEFVSEPNLRIRDGRHPMVNISVFYRAVLNTILEG